MATIKSIASAILNGIFEITDNWTQDQVLRGMVQALYFRLYGSTKEHGPENPHEKSLMASMQTAEARFNELREAAEDNRDDRTETTEEVERAARTFVLRREALEEAEDLLKIFSQKYKQAFGRNWNDDLASSKRDYVAEAASGPFSK